MDNSKYGLTFEPMMQSRDRVINAIDMILRGYTDVFDPNNRETLRYASFYLSNDGAIREKLKTIGIKPTFKIVDNDIILELNLEKECKNCPCLGNSFCCISEGKTMPDRCGVKEVMDKLEETNLPK